MTHSEGQGDPGATRVYPRRALPDGPRQSLDAREIGSLSAVNPLVAAANPLLLAMASLRHAAAPASAHSLRERLLLLVADFEQACDRASIATDQRELAKYALCTAVDEAVQRTAWSGNKEWARQGLLVQHFKEHSGGEKFFQVLDKLMQSPARFMWLLQLYYVCLSLGFMGRYLLQGPQGRAALTELRERVYQLLRQAQAEPEYVLSNRWQGVPIAVRKFKGFSSVWFVAGVSLLLVLLAYLAFWALLRSERESLELKRLSFASEKAEIPALPNDRPRLRQFLLEEIKRKQVDVFETPMMSKVTLLDKAAFDSGSARPRADAEQLLAQVAAALAKVEGQVMVIGHTDNVPLRSSTFASNAELSQARARIVAEQIRGRLKDPERVRYEGRGDAEPLDAKANQDDAEQRQKNRRVEVVLRVPSELSLGSN